MHFKGTLHIPHLGTNTPSLSWLCKVLRAELRLWALPGSWLNTGRTKPGSPPSTFQAYLASRESRKRGPLYLKVAHSSLNVVHSYRPPAFQVLFQRTPRRSCRTSCSSYSRQGFENLGACRTVGAYVIGKIVEYVAARK